MKHGIVSRITDSMFNYQGWPTVTRDENGTLYAASSGHRLGHVCPFGKNLLYVSHDDGETWSAPRIINDSVLDDRDAGLCYLGDGKLLLSWFNLSREFYWNGNMAASVCNSHAQPYGAELAEGMMKSWKLLPDELVKPGCYVRLSRDYGEHWEEPVMLPVSSPHGPTLLQNGKILYFGKESASESKNGKNGIAAYESADDGKTWERLATIQLPDIVGPNDCHEPYAVQLPSGRILGAIRAHGPNMPHGFSILLCHSDDNGKTWSIPSPTGFDGAPPHLFLHSSGAVVLTYGRRIKPFAEIARISYDGGETWGEEIVLDDRSADSDLGYPSTTELSDGSLITVYYQKFPGDKKCSILYTKWELPTK